MFKNLAIIALVGGAAAVQHHHHHHNLVALSEDPDCTTSQNTGRCSLGHYAGEGTAPYPVDYVVPNWGQDEDVKSTLAFAQAAETEEGVTWTPSAAPATPKRGYFVPNFGVDHDVVDSIKNLAATETVLKHKLKIPKSERPKGSKVPAAQLERMNAPGGGPLDQDVVTTLKNEKAAAESLGQQWKIEWS
jgi:hypothetical protein